MITESFVLPSCRPIAGELGGQAGPAQLFRSVGAVTVGGALNVPTE